MSLCPVCAAPLDRARIASSDRLHGTPGRFEVAVCSICGAGVTQPPASAAVLARFYPQGYGPHERTDARPLALISAAIRGWQGVLVRGSPPLVAIRGRRPGRGLDVGAGRGDLSEMLQARGWQMTAVEPSAGAVGYAMARGIDAREGVMATAELEAGSYDCAIFKHSLEHAVDPVDDLRRARMALKPGGLVLISVPNFGSWQRLRFEGFWYHLDLPRHRVHFSAGSLERALAEAGFVDIVLDRSSSAVGLPASLQYRLAGRCLFPSGLALRVATGLCALTLPLTWALDRVLGEPDTLHAVARRGNAQSAG
jgi:SAM-dependent methyltransferase